MGNVIERLQAIKCESRANAIYVSPVLPCLARERTKPTCGEGAEPCPVVLKGRLIRKRPTFSRNPQRSRNVLTRRLNLRRINIAGLNVRQRDGMERECNAVFCHVEPGSGDRGGNRVHICLVRPVGFNLARVWRPAHLFKTRAYLSRADPVVEWALCGYRGITARRWQPSCRKHSSASRIEGSPYDMPQTTRHPSGKPARSSSNMRCTPRESDCAYTTSGEPFSSQTSRYFAAEVFFLRGNMHACKISHHGSAGRRRTAPSIRNSER